MVSIAIPSKTELFLYKTTKDILEKARGEIEIFVMLDGYDLPDNEIIKDDRVRYIRMPTVKYTQKRHAVNKMVELCKGEYVMSVDAHCMFAEGFDVQLVMDHGADNWVQIPRRHRLDAENWCLQTQSDSRPPIDYEYILFNSLLDGLAFHGFRWDLRTRERWDIPIDDTLEFQGSCWFMKKDWFKECGFMQIEGYTGWGQEAEEISFTTWLKGGRVVTNKNTWYAHLHKGAKYGRMYWMSRQALRDCYEYSFNLWAIQRKDFIIDLFDRFMPMPRFPKDWKERLWKI